GEHLRRLARHEAGQLGGRSLAQQDRVARRSGRLERLLHAARQHQDRREDEHHQAEPRRGGDGREAAAQDGANVVGERDHSCLRSAFTTCMRPACQAGIALARAPMTAAQPRVRAAVPGLKEIPVKKPRLESAFPNPISTGRAATMPSAPPATPSSAPSATEMAPTCRGKNPMARMAPISGVRSRRPIASVLPRISAMMSRITPLTISSAPMIAEEPCTNCKRKDFSVSVWVSLSLLANKASMARTTWGERAASATVMV